MRETQTKTTMDFLFTLTSGVSGGQRSNMLCGIPLRRGPRSRLEVGFSVGRAEGWELSNELPLEKKNRRSMVVVAAL